MSTRWTWRVGVAAVALVGVSLVVVGCGGSSGTEGGKPEAQPAAQAQAQAQPAAQTPAPAQAAAPAQTAADTPPAAAAAPALPTQEHETGAEVTLVEAKRTAGDSVTVKWRYRNTTGKDLKIAKGGTSWLDAYQLTGDAFVVDTVNKKKYLVITDAEKYPLASKHGDWQGVTLTPGQTLSAWAKFPAPPAEVEKVSVTIPGVAPFEDVPIVK